MPGNPFTPQGTLNRLRATIVIPDFPTLTVTPSYLTRMGVRLAFDGNNVLYIPCMVGAVTSDEPYLLCTITAHLNKAGALANQFEQQRLLESVIGDITVRPDTSALFPYQITNAAIEQVRELGFAGDDADYAVTLRGVYYINNNLWG